MDNYLGEIRIFTGNYAPANWALCEGQTLSISQYQALYTLLGTTYGGDGISTFGLPDLRGRAALHQGQGSGLSNYALGGKGGADTVTVTANQLPAHSHTLFASAGTATSGTPSAANLPGQANGGFYTPATTAAITAFQLSPTAVGWAGGNQEHDNSMPSLALSYIIALVGIYPTAQ